MPDAIPPAAVAPPSSSQSRSAQAGPFQVTTPIEVSPRSSPHPDTEKKQIDNEYSRAVAAWLPVELRKDIQSRRMREDLRCFVRVGAIGVGAIGLLTILVALIMGRLPMLGEGIWSIPASLGVYTAVSGAFASLVLLAGKPDSDKPASKAPKSAIEDGGDPSDLAAFIKQATEKLIS